MKVAHCKTCKTGTYHDIYRVDGGGNKISSAEMAIFTPFTLGFNWMLADKIKQCVNCNKKSKVDK